MIASERKAERKTEMKKSILLDLFFTFAKIGLFTFGGGYAMIPMMERNCVEIKGWITHDEMLNVTIIAESTPGPVSINCATFVGLRQAGLWGALVATLGMVLPSFVIIYVISVFLENFLEITVIANAFKGIKIAVGLLILDAGLNMIGKMLKQRRKANADEAKADEAKADEANADEANAPRTVALQTAIMVISCAMMLAINIFSWHISTIILMLAAALIGLAVFMARSFYKRGDGGIK